MAKNSWFLGSEEGKLPLVHAYIYENGGETSVNGDGYLELLQDKVLAFFSVVSKTKNLWWIQERTSLRTAPVWPKSSLWEKFRARVIRRETELVWLACRKDFNPLDFHLWAVAHNQLCLQKLESIEEIIECGSSRYAILLKLLNCFSYTRHKIYT